MRKRTILVTGPELDPNAVKLAQDHGFETVHTPAYADSAVIAELLVKSGAEGIVSRMGRIDATVMDAAPQLKVISKHGVGVDNIDLEAATARGITVLMATGANAVSVAEHAITLLLATVKRVVPLDASLHAGRWEKPGFLGRELAGSRLGLLGMGSIAQATGQIAKGFGLELYGYDPYAKPAAFADLGVTRCESLPEFFAQCDLLSLHCPLTNETRGIVNAGSIAQMPKGAFIINTARGGLIDEAALVAAIRSGHLGGAGLDTFAVEPPAADHPFFAEPSIVLTPHIGGVTREAGARVGVDAVRGILQVLAGEPVGAERIANRALLAKAAEQIVKAGE
jgi:D-3-phosphoglycerate dehydrogenase / 2-oxoglutarate reductase